MKRARFFASIAILLATTTAASRAPDGGTPSTQSKASDGPVTLTATIDRPSVRVAEPVQFVFEVEAPKGSRIELPATADRLGDFDVRHTERAADIPSATAAGKRTWTLRLTLETIKTGQLAIPPLDVHYAIDPKDTTFKTLVTSPIPIHIASVLENRADPKRFRDIKQTVDVPVSALESRTWIAWTVGGATAAAVVALLIVALAKRRNRGVTPAAWALGAIDELAKCDAKAVGPESLFNESVDVVREYFELEFNVPALPRTSREFLSAATNDVKVPAAASKRLAWLAGVADAIKFARLRVTDEHAQQALEQAKAFIAECEAHRRAKSEVTA